MTTIQIQTDDNLLTALEKMAASQSKTVDTVVNEILWQHLQSIRATPQKKYSFIGIGQSGQKNLSTQVNEILAQAINRREGWCFPE